MRVKVRKELLVVSLILFSSCAILPKRAIEERPSPPPEWLEKVPPPDQRYIYFTGVKTEAPSEEKGIAAAFADGLSYITSFLGTIVTYKYNQEKVEREVLRSIRGRSVSDVKSMNKVVERLELEGAHIIRKARIKDVYVKVREVGIPKLVRFRNVYDVWVLVAYPKEEERKLRILSHLLPPGQKLTPEMARREERRLKELEVKGRYSKKIFDLLLELLNLSYDDVRYIQDYSEGRPINYIYFTTDSPLEDFLRLDHFFHLERQVENRALLKISRFPGSIWLKLTEDLAYAREHLSSGEKLEALRGYCRAYRGSGGGLLRRRLHRRIEDVVRAIGPTDPERSFRILQVLVEEGLFDEARSVLISIQKEFAVSSREMERYLEESFEEVREKEVPDSEKVSLTESLAEVTLASGFSEKALFGNLTSYLRHIDPVEYEKWAEKRGLSEYWKADSLYALGELKAAEDKALDAMEKGLIIPEVYLLLGKAEFFSGEHNRARNHLLQAAEGSPAQAYALLGHLGLEEGKHKKAESYFRRSLEVKGNEGAYLGLAKLHLAQRDSAKALKNCLSAMGYSFERVKPPIEESWFCLGCANVLGSLSYHENALDLLEKVKELSIVPPSGPSLSKVREEILNLRAERSSIIKFLSPEEGSVLKEEKTLLSFQIWSEDGVRRVKITNLTTGYKVNLKFDGSYNISSDWQVPLSPGWNAICFAVNGGSKKLLLVRRK